MIGCTNPKQKRTLTPGPPDVVMSVALGAGRAALLDRRGKALPPDHPRGIYRSVGAGAELWYSDSAMEGRGVENPVFEPPSPDAGRQRRGSSAKVDAGIPEQFGEGPCGWGCFAPKALQVCNNPEGFLAMYSLLAIFQGMVVNGLINISISTIEKRYELNSSLTGLISASYDISFCLLALFVSFFGERGHKPRWLAFSAFMLGLGSLIFSLPHFSSGKYHFGTKLEGIGYAMSLLGPAVGYVLGGQLLNIYIDIEIPERTGMLHNLTAPCNANCGCSRSMYYPVCGRDEVQYFSPCFAGCASLVINKMKKMYHNCSCIGKPERQTGLEDLFYEAVSGKCPTQCKLLPLFLTFFFFAVVFTFMAVTPTTVVRLFRITESSYMLLCFLGTIPGPILFGVAIDNSCTLWDINDCNAKGACWVYDNERMAYLLMGISKWLLHIKNMYSVIGILTWTAR
uniref:Kazal-like domain-containing protein n=1 Tax=Amazona collaria TaxID=241587 RepID=A0A8B9IW25_9PSIT